MLETSSRTIVRIRATSGATIANTHVKINAGVAEQQPNPLGMRNTTNTETAHMRFGIQKPQPSPQIARQKPSLRMSQNKLCDIHESKETNVHHHLGRNKTRQYGPVDRKTETQTHPFTEHQGPFTRPRTANPQNPDTDQKKDMNASRVPRRERSHHTRSNTPGEKPTTNHTSAQRATHTPSATHARANLLRHRFRMPCVPI